MKSHFTRRFFIGGLLGTLAGGPRRVFSDSAGTFSAGRPELSFGVLSDVHVAFRKGCETFRDRYGTETLVCALQWFRDKGVDAVIIAGDMAHWGLVGELQAVADAWFHVFPNDRTQDGRSVARVFIFGNHEWSSLGRAMRVMPDEVRCREMLLAANPRKWWERVFHEPWMPFFEKIVKGYRFECSHWWSSGRTERFAKGGLKEFYAAHASQLDPQRPFFHIQHPHPRGTVHGAHVWGQDDGSSTEILSAYPNCVAFSGHSHTSLTDERFIWQGAFTSIGCGSLRNVSPEIPVDGLSTASGTENGIAVDASESIDSFKAMPPIDGLDCRQGQLVRVYADRIVFSRQEFMTGSAIGDDIVMPLPAAEHRPFDFGMRKASTKVPAFPKGAKVSYRRASGVLRGGRKVKRREAIVWELTIPAANAVRSARAAIYEIVANGEDGETRMFLMTDEGARFPAGDSRAAGPFKFRVVCDRLPFSVRSFSVRAVSCWGKYSEPLVVSVREQEKKNVACA